MSSKNLPCRARLSRITETMHLTFARTAEEVAWHGEVTLAWPLRHPPEFDSS
jgi:hypothetical protein